MYIEKELIDALDKLIRANTEAAEAIHALSEILTGDEVDKEASEAIDGK